MSYTESYLQLKNALNLEADEIAIPGSKLVIRNFGFDSVIPDTLSFLREDTLISENFHFRYPVILEKDAMKSDKVILFMHGLNERTWHKHLTGAKLLAERTHRPVLLFPLSYHINRGLSEWTDVRKMAIPLEERRSRLTGVQDASVINLALSERLTESPQRFILSGIQSINDLITLINILKSGKHPLFRENVSVDMFAYSISCMLLQALMISNPSNVISNSRIVLFAGGSVFSHINGISKFIMDSVAFQKLRNFHMQLVEKKNTLVSELQPLIMEHEYGKAFRCLIQGDVFRKKREQSVSDFNRNLLVIALRNDKVMPLEGIKIAMGKKFYSTKNFKIVHFPFPYTHENPFPVLINKLEKLVEESFLSVFNPAVEFYNKA